MSLQLAEIIRAVRDRHPAFHKTRVPDAVLARFYTGYQRRLIELLCDVDENLVAQQCSIVFAATPENAIGVVAAGSAGGLPTSVDSGVPATGDTPAGPTVEIDLENAAVLVPETVCTGATASTLTKTGAGWTVNAYAGKLLYLPNGPGARQRREIVSNTADTLTIVGTFETVPVANDTTFTVLEMELAIVHGLGAVTEVMPEGVRQGYLVRLDANGAPYIDIGKPLVARFDVGVQLPPHNHVLGGTVRDITQRVVGKFSVRPWRQRYVPTHEYWGWMESGKLFLGGSRTWWNGIDSLDLRYVPIAPTFTALTDLFLLADNAYDALVSAGVVIAAERINAQPDQARIELMPLSNDATIAQGAFLGSAGRPARAEAQFVEDIWP